MYAFLTLKGGAAAASQELSEHGITARDSGIDYVLADATDKQIQTVHVHAQTITRAMRLLHEKPVERDALPAIIRTMQAPAGTFALRANGEDRQEFEEEYGGLINDATGATVNLSKPDTLYYLFETEGQYLLGIDLFGDIGKRHYKIVTGATSLTGPFAACALRIAGWQPKHDLVVWPCATGELAIEAALWASKKSPRAYQLSKLEDKEPKKGIIAADAKLAMVRSCEKNAKVAGVMQYIRFSRQDADWLDTKYEEHELKHMIGLLPNLTLYPKLTKELFYQLEYILKPGGNAAFICVNEASAEKLELQAQQEQYELQRHYLWSGKHSYIIVALTRAQKTKRSNA